MTVFLARCFCHVARRTIRLNGYSGLMGFSFFCDNRAHVRRLHGVRGYRWFRGRAAASGSVMRSRFSLRLLLGPCLARLQWVCVDALPSHASYVDLVSAAIAFLLGLIVAPIIFSRNISGSTRG